MPPWISRKLWTPLPLKYLLLGKIFILDFWGTKYRHGIWIEQIYYRTYKYIHGLGKYDQNHSDIWRKFCDLTDRCGLRAVGFIWEFIEPCLGGVLWHVLVLFNRIMVFQSVLALNVGPVWTQNVDPDYGRNVIANFLLSNVAFFPK